jgi:hypothetical protein
LSVFLLAWGVFLVRQFQLDDPLLGRDFGQFYVAGRILNEHGPARLYDTGIQLQLFREIHPGRRNANLWFTGAPFLAHAFRPLAALPYPAAYAVWMLASLALYAGGLAALWPFLDHLPPPWRRVAALAAFSFWPFLAWCLYGGQVSAIAFAAVALTVRLHLSGRPFLAGLALSLCLYKPPLAAFLILVLALGKCTAMVAGFVAGAAILLALSFSSLTGYIAFLSRYAGFAAQGSAPWSTWGRLIDATHFFERLGAPPAWALGICAALSIVLALRLASAWRAAKAPWAATLAASLLCSPYTMIYDSVLAAIAILVSPPVLFRRKAFLGAVAAVYAGAIIGPTLADAIRIHPYTLALVALYLAARNKLPARAVYPGCCPNEVPDH